jgi:hypothetical protein
MSPAVVWSVVGLVVLLFGALIVITRRRERERTEALVRVAETAGLSFQAKADVETVRGLGDVQLYERGHSRRVTNLMTGRVGSTELAVFDYRYTTGAGKNQHTWTQTVAVFPSIRPSLPDLQLAPESPLHKIAEAFGSQDIDIESSPEFSRRYVLKGQDADAIRSVLYPRATSYFGEHEGWTVEARSGTVAIYRSQARPRPEDVMAFVADATEAVRSL